MKVVSFIPIKLNNQRLPGKNTMELAGRPMCDYIFQTIANVKNIDEKYVYCSDEAIKPYIPEGLIYKKRDTCLDGYEVKGLDIIERFVEDVDADVYVLTHVTQPFTKKESLENAIMKVISGKYDSAFSAVEIKDYCWYKGQPLNYNMKDIVTTQNLEPIYMETGAFFIFTKVMFKKLRQRIGENPFMHIVDQFEAIDVDTKEDFLLAEAVAEFLEKRQVLML